MVVTESSPAPPTHPAVATGDRWSASACLLTGAVWPATTAQATQHVSLWAAWRIHVLSTVIVWLEIGVMALVLEVRPWSFHRAIDEIVGFVFEVLDMAERHSQELLAIVGGTALGIELGFVALGLLIAPWGARVEPIGRTYQHGLRRAWLQTPHIAWGIAVVAMLAIPLEQMSSDWRRANNFSFQAPSIPTPGPQATPAEMAAFNKAQQAALQQQQQLWQQWRDSQPFYVQYQEEITIGVSFAAGVWFLWALLRAVGAPRMVEQQHQPPLCEFCGYNLSTMPLEARCPECGEPVIESLGPQVRPGTAWQQRAQIGRVPGYLRSCLEAALFPDRLGRQLRVYTPGTDHRLLFALHAVLIGVVSWAGFILTVCAADGVRVLEQNPEVYFIGMVIGAMVASAAVGGLLLAAGLAGLDRHIRDRRNLLTASMQVASYLSGALVVGIAFAWLSGAYCASEPRVFRRWGLAIHADRELLAFCIWAMVNLVWLGIWLLTAWRGTAAARFANR